MSERKTDWNTTHVPAVCIQPAPSIASLPEEWRTRIETVRQKAATEIAAYAKILRSIDMAENADTSALRTASANALEDIKQKQYADMLRARQDIEWQIASAFAPELVALCRQKNPTAYDAVAAHHGDSKMMPIILGLLYYDVYYNIRNLPLGPSTTLPSSHHSTDENPRPVSQHPIDSVVPDTSTDAGYEGTSVTNTRLKGFEDHYEKQYCCDHDTRYYRAKNESGNPMRPIKTDALASLADTLASIWEETIHPRILQPERPSFPHVYSIVEELVGHKPLPRQQTAHHHPLAVFGEYTGAGQSDAPDTCTIRWYKTHTADPSTRREGLPTERTPHPQVTAVQSRGRPIAPPSTDDRSPSCP